MPQITCRGLNTAKNSQDMIVLIPISAKGILCLGFFAYFLTKIILVITYMLMFAELYLRRTIRGEGLHPIFVAIFLKFVWVLCALDESLLLLIKSIS